MVGAGSGCPITADRFRADVLLALDDPRGPPGLRPVAPSDATPTTPTSGCCSPEWENVGSYRRALSPFEVKMTAVPLLSRSIDEPTAYEVVVPGAGLNEHGSRSIP